MCLKLDFSQRACRPPGDLCAVMAPLCSWAIYKPFLIPIDINSHWFQYWIISFGDLMMGPSYTIQAINWNTTALRQCQPLLSIRRKTTEFPIPISLLLGLGVQILCVSALQQCYWLLLMISHTVENSGSSTTCHSAAWDSPVRVSTKPPISHRKWNSLSEKLSLVWRGESQQR